jgi:Histidine kinase-like ATPase domain
MAGCVRLVTRASAVHVRTARLVAVTIARRAGFDEDVVESVRQGVGEACAMVVHSAEPEERLELLLVDSPRELEVLVLPAPRGWEDGAGDLATAVLEGLTDELGLTDTPRGEALRLRWRG